MLCFTHSKEYLKSLHSHTSTPSISFHFSLTCPSLHPCELPISVSALQMGGDNLLSYTFPSLLEHPWSLLALSHKIYWGVTCHIITCNFLKTSLSLSIFVNLLYPLQGIFLTYIPPTLSTLQSICQGKKENFILPETFKPFWTFHKIFTDHTAYLILEEAHITLHPTHQFTSYLEPFAYILHWSLICYRLHLPQSFSIIFHHLLLPTSSPICSAPCSSTLL